MTARLCQHFLVMVVNNVMTNMFRQRGAMQPKSFAIMLACGLLTSTISATRAEELPPEPVRQIVQERCALCHGVQGEASSQIYPRLAAQNRQYLEKQLRNFREGLRKSDIMNEQARDLTDEQITALAAWYSSRPALTHRLTRSRKRLAVVGRYLYHYGNKWAEIPACSECHGEKGAGNETLPRLAGQHRRYVLTQLQNFHQRKRTNDNAIMHFIASKLTPMEMEALATYASALGEKEDPGAPCYE